MVEHLCLLLHQWGNSIFNLLLNDLRQRLLHGLRDSLLYLDLQVFLSLNLLLERVHFHVELSKLLVKFNIILNYHFLLSFLRLWYWNYSNILLFLDFFLCLLNFLLRLLLRLSCCLSCVYRGTFSRRRCRPRIWLLCLVHRLWLSICSNLLKELL